MCVVTVASDGGLIQGLVHCLDWRLEDKCVLYWDELSLVEEIWV